MPNSHSSCSPEDISSPEVSIIHGPPLSVPVPVPVHLGDGGGHELGAVRDSLGADLSNLLVVVFVAEKSAG